MFNIKDLQRLDQEGKLQELFHPEVYEEYVNFMMGRSTAEPTDEEIRFTPNRKTRTGQESAANVQTFLENEKEMEDELPKESVEAPEDAEECEEITRLTTFQPPI